MLVAGRCRISEPMQVSLGKNSDVPLHEQLAEQIVYLITSGKLKSSQQLASVRSLARQLHIHHNTVSRAYQDLVRRGWLRRRRGSRLYVGASPEVNPKTARRSLDELINESIDRAREMGYSLQELRARSLSASPHSHQTTSSSSSTKTLSGISFERKSVPN